MFCIAVFINLSGRRDRTKWTRDLVKPGERCCVGKQNLALGSEMLK